MVVAFGLVIIEFGCLLPQLSILAKNPNEPNKVNLLILDVATVFGLHDFQLLQVVKDELKQFLQALSLMLQVQVADLVQVKRALQ